MVAVVRPEHVPEPFVAALADQVQVEFAERRQVTVRVVGEPARRPLVPGLQAVILQAERADALPDAVGDVGEFDVRAGGEDREHLGRERPERADDDERVRDAGRAQEMLAEHLVGVVVAAFRDRFEDVGRDGGDRHLRAACRLVHPLSFHLPWPVTCRMCTGSVNASRRT